MRACDEIRNRRRERLGRCEGTAYLLALAGLEIHRGALSPPWAVADESRRLNPHQFAAALSYALCSRGRGRPHGKAARDETIDG